MTFRYQRLAERRRRMWLLVGTAVMFAGGAIGVACSNNNPNNDGGGPDTGTGDTTLDAPKGDTGPGTDGGKESGPPVTCEAGVSGQCDIVAQNCGAGQQCALATAPDGGFVLKCVSAGTGSFPEGTACNTTSQCVGGLECIENRCAKHCCLNDDQACSTSKPENFPGACNLNITLPDNSIAYSVCTYDKPCQPFQIQGCGSGETCLVQDSNGTAKCSTYPNGDAGQAEKTTCSSSNACNDGMGCYGGGDGGFTCQWNCYVKGQGGSYDNQIAADAGAGFGGCPSNETCTPINWGGSLPAWFGLCK